MKSKEWKIPYSRPEISPELLDSPYGSLLKAVLASKGIKSLKEAKELISGDYELFYDPMLMKGMDRAVIRLRQAIEKGETVAVYGDYDVDGITATCLVTDYLRFKGLSCVPYIPDRSDEGYGINCNALKSLHEKGVSLVVSVDCGITAVSEVEYAKTLGMDLIITDHHECKDGALPEPYALIDCKQPGDSYPNPELCGVAVGLKLCCACEGDYEKILRRYCDLVAVGTIADVMPLVGENRFLVKKGLNKLKTAPRPGFSALLHEAGIERKNITASTVGFSLAPRLNAAGRLCEADVAGELLMCPQEQEAEKYALRLCQMNRQRQDIEMDILNEAEGIMEHREPKLPIVLASENWHQGVIGIVASKLAEQYGVPAIMVCLNQDVGKGSCRSYGSFNLFEALSACQEHLLGFGGHALAAGLTIEKDKLADFRRALGEYYTRNKPKAPPAVNCDLLITDPSVLDLDNVKELDKLEPYGNGNPRPLMCILGAELESFSEVGGGRHLKLRAKLQDECFDGIFFSHTAKELGIHRGDLVDIAFSPQINEFRGRSSVQLLISALRVHEPEELCRAILEKDKNYVWGASVFCPERPDFIRVWREFKKGFPVKSRVEEILSQCPLGMVPEKFCICLMTLLECGLLCSNDGRIYGAKSVKINGKADLEATGTMRTLRALKCIFK